MRTVLFDIGNVIASDYWEALWLSPQSGLADRLGIPVAVASEVGNCLWRRYSIVSAHEEDYWHDFERLIGARISLDDVRESEATNIKPNTLARETFLRLTENGVRIGVISNNTSFWAPKQLYLANVTDFVDEGLHFISSDAAADKTKSNPNLFEVARNALDAKSTLIIDDRPGNIQTAKCSGFQASLYGDPASGVQADGYYKANRFSELPLLSVVQAYL